MSESVRDKALNLSSRFENEYEKALFCEFFYEELSYYDPGIILRFLGLKERPWLSEDSQKEIRKAIGSSSTIEEVHSKVKSKISIISLEQLAAFLTRVNYQREEEGMKSNSKIKELLESYNSSLKS